MLPQRYGGAGRGPFARFVVIEELLAAGAPIAAHWLADRQSGWLAGYDLPNVVVFDYYDVLTDRGRTDWSAYPTQGGRDSHPSAEGQAKAAAAFVPFLQQAVRGMGWETAATAAATP